jgi:Domain of unknown function (DUF1918)
VVDGREGCYGALSYQVGGGEALSCRVTRSIEVAGVIPMSVLVSQRLYLGRGPAGAPPYRVRTEDGHETIMFPGPDSVIGHRKASEQA